MLRSLMSAGVAIGLVLSGWGEGDGTKCGESPFCALRVGSLMTAPENWPAMREALSRNRAAFDEVWMSTGISFPALAWHEAHARECAAAAADLRQLGIVPSLEIQTIIGHSEGILKLGDNAGQDWSRWVDCFGRSNERISCPSDPKLAQYFARVGELYAAWRPGSVWVDDDMTIRARTCGPHPSGLRPLDGCFCERCCEIFSRAENRVWTREALVEAMRKDAQLEARWKAAQGRNIGELGKAIAEAVRRVSPETAIGYQFGGQREWQVSKGLAEGAGGKVRLRIGGGAYWDTNPHEQIMKACWNAAPTEFYRQFDWVGEICPEIESCPRTYCCRTPQGFILESFANLAYGMDFLSLYAADANNGESPEFYRDRLFPRLAAAHPFLKGFRDANRGALPCAFTVAWGPDWLVPCRGVPVMKGRCRSLGELPKVETIPARTKGSDWIQGQSRETRILQIASSVALLDYYARCDEASGNRMPVRFESAVMAFALPNMREDGSLATVAIVNATIDEQPPVVVRLRGVPSDADAMLWVTPEAAPVRLPVDRGGGLVRVTLPALAAWKCGYLTLAGASAADGDFKVKGK